MVKSKQVEVKEQKPVEVKVCLPEPFERVAESVLVLQGGTVRYANGAVRRMFGCRAEDLCGSDVFDRLDDEGREQLSGAMEKLSKATGEIEAPIGLGLRGTNGCWRAVDGRLRGLSRSTDCLILALSDAREGGMMREGLQPIEGAYDALEEGSAGLLMLCGEDHVIRYAGPSVKEDLGYDPEEVIGRSLPRLMHPDDRERATEQVLGRTASSTGLVVRYRRKDGTWANLESAADDLLADPRVTAVLLSGGVRAEEEYRPSQNLDSRVSERTADPMTPPPQIRAQEPLPRETVESLRSIFEHAAVGIVQLGADGGWSMANRRFCEMVGYTGEELFRRTFRDHVHPEDRDNDLEEKQRLLDGTIQTYPVEKRCVRRDGSVVWLKLTASLVRGSGGSPNGFVLVAEDITERKRSQAALRQSEEHYRAVVEQASEGIFLVGVEDKRILEYNAAFQKLLGYSEDELLGMTLGEFVVLDEEMPSVESFVERVLTEGNCGGGEKQYLRKDGSVVDVEVNARMIHYNGRDVLCCVAHDITERKASEEELRLREERFRYLVQYASDVITIMSRDGTILYESPSIRHVLGYEPDDLIGAGAFEYVHPDDTARVRAALGECLSGKTRVSSTVAFRFRHADGSWRRLEAIGSNLVDKPSVGGVVVNARDITERERAEASLRHNLDLLLALHEANRTLSSTLEVEEIASRLLEIMRHVSSLDAAGVRIVGGERWGRVDRTVGSQELWHRLMEVPETARAREAVLQDKGPVSFRLSTPEHGGACTVGLCLPLRTRNVVVGVLEAYGPDSLAEDSTVQILESLARQAASALENARLYEQLGEREQRLQDLVGKLLTAQEEERRRVAYEVHDGLAQVAVAAHQHLQVFARRHHWGRPKSQEDLQRILKLVRSTVTESRRIIANLRPTALDDLGLAPAIALEVENLRNSGYRVDFEEKLEDQRLPAPVEIALYRVIQEALTNMRKHAQSERVCIRLWRQDGWAYTEVRDWGRGFDPEKGLIGEGPGERVGLSGMRERVVPLGGRFEVRSWTGGGTSVVAGIPL